MPHGGSGAGDRAASRKNLASSRIASFSACSRGTKESSVSTRPTPGRLARRSASATAASASAVSTSMVKGEASGSLRMSASVAIDSLGAPLLLSGRGATAGAEQAAMLRVAAACVRILAA